MMSDAPGSDDMTMLLPGQLLHKELVHSFPRICSSDPRRQHCSLLTTAQLLLLIQNFWPPMEGYKHLVPAGAHTAIIWPVPSKASSLERVKKKKIKIKKNKIKTWLPLGRWCCVSIPKCLGCKRQCWGQAAADPLVGLPSVGGRHPGIRARAPGQCLAPDPQWEARTETMVGGIWQRTWGKKNPLFAATAWATSLWLLPHAGGAETRSMDGKTTHIKDTIPDKTSSLQPALSTSPIPIFARHWAKGSRACSGTPEGNELCASWHSPSAGLHSWLVRCWTRERVEKKQKRRCAAETKNQQTRCCSVGVCCTGIQK